MSRLASRFGAQCSKSSVVFFVYSRGVDQVYVCYIDESGTPEVPGNTSHFILAGISIPIWHWHDADREITAVLKKYGLEDEELHTAWLLRSYVEQSHIANFDKLDWTARRSAANRERNTQLLRLQKTQNSKSYKQTKKNYRHTNAYAHLTRSERKILVCEVADCISKWGFARLFAECIDKIYLDSSRNGQAIGEQAFEQLVSRFEQFLENINKGQRQKIFGILIHDNNQTIAKKHTNLMMNFHSKGTLWTNIKHIIETPLFVDSKLTRMVQVADLCSYALRRYVENGETDLFGRIFVRADRHHDKTVGVRHFCAHSCTCDICKNH